MTKTVIRKPYVIEDANAEKFNERVDKFIESVALMSPEAHVERDDGKFIAVIYFSKEIVQIETVEDEFKLKGISYICGDCPYYSLSQDKRIRYTDCEKGHCRVYYDMPACEELYEMVKKGDVKID